MSLHDICHYRDEDLTHPGIQKEGFKGLSQTLDSFSTLLNSPGSSRFISAKPCVRLAALLSRKKKTSIDIYEEKSNIGVCSKKAFSYNTALFVFEILFH